MDSGSEAPALTEDPLSSSRRSPAHTHDASLDRQSPARIQNKANAQPRSSQPQVGTARGQRTGQPPAISRGICTRIAQWLWPGGWGPSCESPGLGPASAGANSQQSASRPQLQIQPYASASLDCKACREWNVVCDHTRPQCEHCYEQQILCFYVSPSPKPKQKARRRGENLAAGVATISEERARAMPDAPVAATG